MLAAEEMRRMGGAGQSWQPDPRASLGLASAAAALLCLAFLGLLYHPIVGTRPALLTLSVIHGPRAQRPAHRQPRLAVPAAAVLTPLTPLPPVPGTILLQEQIDQVVRETASGTGSGAFLAQPTRPYDQLSQALQAPEKPGTLKEGDSYRSNYGDTIVKSGGGCTALQELQIGPVAKAQIGFMAPCPGEYQPTMTDDLAAWAAKRAQGEKPPPR